jgi:DNA mismatch repair protein MutS
MSQEFSTLEKSQTPMMKQYSEIKSQYQDSILLYRMGDFYELFYDDAVKSAPVLGVALTRRGKQDGQDIPMCGVPFHSVDLYIMKLIKAGFKVAICDQLESPEEAKKRGYKAVVKRDVTRILTKGTLIEEGLLEEKVSNYLAAIVERKGQISLAYADISTFEFKVISLDENELENFIVNLNPVEVIVQDKILADKRFANIVEVIKTKLVNFVDSFFEEKKCYERLKSNFNLYTVESLGNFSSTAISACGAIIEYLLITQKQEKIKINFPLVQDQSEYVMIDKSVQRNLELFYSSGEYGYSFISVIDKTLTSVGGRLLRKYLAFPSNNMLKISARQKVVGYFLSDNTLLENVRDILKNIPDLERAIARLLSPKGSARELYSIYESLNGVKKLICVLDLIKLNEFITLKESLKEDGNVLSVLDKILVKYDVYLNQGEFVNPDYSEEFKELANLKLNGQQLITQLRDEYRQKTGIHSLKIEFNNVIGYYIEVSKTNISKIVDGEFIHRQTMVNCNRYVTDKLKDLENRLINLNSSIEAIKTRVFNEIAEYIYTHKNNLYKISESLAYVDVMSSFAYLAKEKGYVCPIIDESTELDIKEGRHPVVEHALFKKSNEQFVANDCELKDTKKIWLITGPNMSGKSTFLRQNALIVIMAHIGSYVPAREAKIGIVDRIFSRIGSGDDLARGYSTFLVEMLETAVILNQATKRSLVILDEIGRGTSTYDGIAIAWSCLEYIHDNILCRTLFSTHYNELTELSSQLEHLQCYTVNVKEWNGNVIFLHKVIKGVADRSYGINVAEIAGIPKIVVTRAKEILAKFNDNNYSATQTEDLFSYHNRLESESDNRAVELDGLKKKILGLNLDSLSPKQALDVLFELKEDLVK